MSGKYILQLNLQHVELEQNFFKGKAQVALLNSVIQA